MKSFSAERMMRTLLLAGFVCLTAVVHADEARFAFGVNGDDFSLSTYRVEADGRLRNLGHRPIDKSPSQVIMDPSGEFVLAVSNTTDNLMVFRLNHITGELSPVPGSPFATHTRSPFSISFHPSGRFLFLGVRFGGVGAFRFDPQTGAVTAVPGSPFPAQRRTRAVVVAPSGKYLYAVNAYSNTVSAFGIDEQSGVLHPLPGSPYSVGDFGVIDYRALGMEDVPPEAGGLPHAIAMDPQGHFVFVADKAGGSVSVFAVDPANGGLKAVPGSPFFIGFNPYRLQVHPSGRFLFTTLWGTGKLAVHAIDAASGRLSAIAGSPFVLDSDSPVDVTFNAAGNRAYISNYDGNDISLLDVDAKSGAAILRENLRTRSGPWSLVLAEGKASPQPASTEMFAALGSAGIGRLEATSAGLTVKATAKSGGEAVAVAVSPNHRFAYVLNGPQATLVTFAIDPVTGNLASVPRGVVATGRQPTSLAIDVNGWYLYVTNSGDRNLSVYYLNPSSGGIPESVRGSPIPAGPEPVDIALDEAARYALVANKEAGNISVYRYVNGVSPLIFESRKYGSPFAAGKEPVALVVDPTGRYAYAANAGSNDISAFRLHRKTGALASMPGSPFKTGQRPVALAAHPSGRWLYVANHDSADVRVYRIENELGALASEGPPVHLPVLPKGLRLNPAGTVLTVLAEDGRRLLSFNVDAATGALSPLQDVRVNQAITDMVFTAGFESGKQ